MEHSPKIHPPKLPSEHDIITLTHNNKQKKKKHGNTDSQNQHRQGWKSNKTLNHK